jgi:catechol 2,3-dioxygenase-like lactoylglutathione lyase family enzyme
MKILGIHHIELTVSDLKRSRGFYEKLPGFKVVAEYPNFIMFFNGHFYLGLTDHKQKLREKVFREANVGLDHVSFEVKSKEDLDKAAKIYGGEIKKLSNGLYILAFRDPDNIQLEFCWKEK